MFSTFLCRLFAIALFGAPVLRGAVLVQDSVDSARISRLQSTLSADLVLIDAGHDAGLRQGMVCAASRDGSTIAEILLVDIRPRASCALILDLKSGATLRSGDSVAVKTVSSKK
jgi:hypothetical protein